MTVDITGNGEGGGGGRAKHSVVVCRTDEQFEMARLCAVKDELWT